MSRPTPISGFPEWLPPQRMVEQYVVDHIRDAFERHGFAPVETRAVEPLDQLLRKGETSKEVYVLRRLQADPDDGSDDSLGLHFDLTVPFARYTLENAGRLAFPFRRYQIQKVWRGERPQLGRYREFLQADVDVVDRDELAPHYEAELPLVLADALAALRAVDKLDKIGPARVSALLAETAGATEAQIKATLALAEISAEDASFADPDRGLAILVDAAPRLFGADWAALLGPDGSVAYGSVAAPSQVDLPEPLRARAYESEEMRCAMAPLGTDGVVLVLARTDAPAFHVAELDRLIQLVDAVAVVLAGRPVTA